MEYNFTDEEHKEFDEIVSVIISYEQYNLILDLMDDPFFFVCLGQTLKENNLTYQDIRWMRKPHFDELLNKYKKINIEKGFVITKLFIYPKTQEITSSLLNIFKEFEIIINRLFHAKGRFFVMLPTNEELDALAKLEENAPDLISIKKNIHLII